MNIITEKHNLSLSVLNSWLEYLGIGTISPLKFEGYFKTKINESKIYNIIKG